MLVEHDSELRGNLPHDVTEKIREVLLRFQDIVQVQAQQSNLHTSQVSVLRPCNLCVFMDRENIHVVFTNSEVGRFPLAAYNDIRQLTPTMTSANAAYLAQLEHEWKYCNAFSFSISLLEKAVEKREAVIISLAQQYLAQEKACLEHERRRVQISPIFVCRDFLIDHTLVFVVMPFNPRFQEIYESYIKPSIEDDCAAGLKCATGQDFFAPGSIMEQIWEGINKAKFVIADLTGRNPNVYYELGLAHTVGKRVILLAQNMNDVPFDLQHLRVIIYTDNESGRSYLRNTLVKYVSLLLSEDKR